MELIILKEKQELKKVNVPIRLIILILNIILLGECLAQQNFHLYMFPQIGRSNGFVSYGDGSSKTEYFSKAPNRVGRTGNFLTDFLLPKDYGFGLGISKIDESTLRVIKRLFVSYNIQQSIISSYQITFDSYKNQMALQDNSNTNSMMGMGKTINFDAHIINIRYGQLLKSGKQRERGYSIDKDIVFGIATSLMRKKIGFIGANWQIDISDTEKLYQPTNFSDDGVLQGNVRLNRVNPFGLSLCTGIAFQFYKFKKELLRVELIYTKGFMKLYRQELNYSIHDTEYAGVYRDVVVTRGSNLSLVLSYPIILKKY